MRTIKELLELMLSRTDLFRFGLCQTVNKLYFTDIITVEECNLVEHYINSHRPSKFSSINAYIHRNDTYFWTKGDIKPRIKWLKKHIKLNSK